MAKYRSKFEGEVAKVLKGSYARYEPFMISYVKVHTYKPDWILPNGIILEAKGRFKSEDRAKHLLIKEQHPDLDIRFIFKFNNKLYKSSKTRYSDWCKQYGYKYAFQRLPKKSKLPLMRNELKKWIKEKKKSTDVSDADTLVELVKAKI